MSAQQQPRIAIIGAGFGGIGLAVKLLKAGVRDVTIFESSDGIGGTWWDNRYPGAEVDTPSVIYSYSFMPARWSRTHVRQAELQRYLALVADRFGVTSRIRFRTTIERVEWSHEDQGYRLFDREGLVATAEHVVAAVGLLNRPKTPAWPGLDAFEGPVMHSARWDTAVDLSGLRVAVVGTGSTAAQLVPEVAKVASHVTVFQREPGWVMPKAGREFTPREQEALDDTIAHAIARKIMLFKREKAQFAGAVYRPGTPQNAGAESAARAYIGRVFADRPDLIDLVTPTYAYSGKRPIISDDFYPALKRDNVTLVPHAVARVTKNGVVDVNGEERPFDALVLSTGFDTSFLSSLRIVGPHGVELHDAWGDDATAFLGMMVPRYPNFFIMYGPNTNGGAIASMLELQASYIVAAIKHAKGRRVDVRPGALGAYDALVQASMKGTGFEHAGNYFKSPNGRITTQWPDGVSTYGFLTKVMRHRFWRIDAEIPSHGSRSRVRAERNAEGAESGVLV